MVQGKHIHQDKGYSAERLMPLSAIGLWISAIGLWISGLQLSVSTVVRAFTKTGIITELPSNSNHTDSNNDERDSAILDTIIAHLFNSDTEDEDFGGLVDKE